MNRVTLIRDGRGERRYQPDQYPLTVGGGEGGIPLSGQDKVVAHIGLHQGHPFVQPARDEPPIWHNHERLLQSAWLKSGDQLQIGDDIILWQVQGDQILVSLSRAVVTPVSPPSTPPPSAVSVGEKVPLVASTPVPNSRWHSRWLLFTLFGILLLAALFVIWATPITLEVTPTPETLSLRGFPPAITLSGRSLALPGRYTLTARLSGYQELRESIQVESGADQAFKFHLKKMPGIIAVKSTPAGASLQVDGMLIGDTPIEGLELEAGHHQLRLQARRYLTLEKGLEVIGMDQYQQVTVELKPDWAPVALRTDPAGAEVRENGELLGQTPTTLELEAGEHRLELIKAGYKPHQATVPVQAGQAQELPLIRLLKQDGILNLSTLPSGGSVSIDGEYRGSTPLALKLPADTSVALRVDQAGFRPARRSIELKADEQRDVEIRLEPEYGIVFIAAQPADAELLVDGRSRGAATRRLKLPTRPHQIEIRKAGFEPYRNSVTPLKGVSRNLEVVLKPAKSGGSGQQVAVRGIDRQKLKRLKPTTPFTMGASRREPGRRANENLRRVQLDRAYYIGLREVTNAEFRRFRPEHDSGSLDKVDLNGDGLPVVNISWDEAARYTNWLSTKEGLPPAYQEQAGRMRLVQPVGPGYRLPTEAEWAYAARFAGREQPARYPWPGSQFPPSRVQGNYADSSAGELLPLLLEDYHDKHAATAPVASFGSNPAGLYDLDGNVAEWVQDYYSVYPGVVGKLSIDPLGPKEGRHHVVRGSSWRDATMTELRLSYRDYSEKPRNDLGFRIARYAQ